MAFEELIDPLFEDIGPAKERKKVTFRQALGVPPRTYSFKGTYRLARDLDPRGKFVEVTAQNFSRSVKSSSFKFKDDRQEALQNIRRFFHANFCFPGAKFKLTLEPSDNMNWLGKELLPREFMLSSNFFELKADWTHYSLEVRIGVRWNAGHNLVIVDPTYLGSNVKAGLRRFSPEKDTFGDHIPRYVSGIMWEESDVDVIRVLLEDSRVLQEIEENFDDFPMIFHKDKVLGA